MRRIDICAAHTLTGTTWREDKELHDVGLFPPVIENNSYDRSKIEFFVQARKAGMNAAFDVKAHALGLAVTANGLRLVIPWDSVIAARREITKLGIKAGAKVKKHCKR